MAKWEKLQANTQPYAGQLRLFMVDGTERPFVAFFVNKRRIGSGDVKVSGRGPFHATIKIMTQIEGKREEIVIHNVYNPIEKNGDPRHREGRYEGIATNSALPLLESALGNTMGKSNWWWGTLKCIIANGTTTTIRVLGTPPQLKPIS
jgi:hypothetical protein